MNNFNSIPLNVRYTKEFNQTSIFAESKERKQKLMKLLPNATNVTLHIHTHTQAYTIPNSFKVF